ERGELLAAGEPVEAADLAQQRLEAAGDDVACLERAGACRRQRARETVAIALRAAEPRARRPAIEEAVPQRGGRVASAHSPELQENREVLVELGLRLELEMGDLPPLPGTVRNVQKVRNALRCRAEAGQPLVRPGLGSGPRQLRKHRIFQEKSDAQLG